MLPVDSGRQNGNSRYNPNRADIENAGTTEINYSIKESTTMRKVDLIFLAAAAVSFLAAPLAFAQGGNMPASTKESGTIAGHGMAAGEQASEPKGATDAKLVGTWTLVSETAHQGDKTTQPLGPHPQGMMMFDRGGRFMMFIARPGLPKFAAGKRDAGTPEENKAVLAGLLAFFGTYSVNEADQVLILHPEASTFPNWNGADQKRFLRFAGDQQIWTNRTPAIGAEVVEVVWRRAQ
jgi:Lipocalin-like domain